MNKSRRNSNLLLAGFDQNILERGITMKKILQYIVLLFIVGFGFTSCGGNIAKVKNAVSVFDEGRTLGVAMDNNPYLKGGKYSAYKSSSGHEIVRYEKEFTTAYSFDEFYPRYDERGFPFGEAALSDETESDPGVANFMAYMNFFVPKSSGGDPQGIIVTPEGDDRTALYAFGKSLYDEFMEFYTFYDTVVDERVSPSIYDTVKHFLTDFEARDYFLQTLDTIRNTWIPSDPHIKVYNFVHSQRKNMNYTVDEMNDILDFLFQHEYSTLTQEEGETFRTILWQSYDLQSELDANWPTYYAKWGGDKEGGKWAIAQYADTPEYLTFEKGVIAFYFYIDQSTKEPVPLSIEIRGHFNANVPDAYTGPVVVHYVDLDINDYNSQVVFFKRWMNGKY
jgi:hypothetical protein